MRREMHALMAQKYNQSTVLEFAQGGIQSNLLTCSSAIVDVAPV